MTKDMLAQLIPTRSSLGSDFLINLERLASQIRCGLFGVLLANIALPFDGTALGVALRTLYRVVACSVVLVLTGTVAAAKPAVSDTGYEFIQMIVSPSLYWVDNNRLLFAGIKRADMEAAIAAKESDRVARLRKLYLWDEGTKSTRLYADAQAACFSNGFISYRLRVDKVAGKQIVREGPRGSEKEIEKPLPPKYAVRSNFTCKYHLRSDLVPPARPFRKVVILREGDGYLDLGPGGGKDYFEQRRAFPRNLTLYQSTNGSAITLPMTWEESFSQFAITYSDYRNAYVLPPQMPRGSQLGVVRTWPKDRPLIVYLVRADGRTQTVTVPYWPAEYLEHPQPTKAGWIFGGGKSPKTGGLYLFDGTSVVKIQAGFVREIAVTPDGCKAAVGINNKPYDMGTPISLKIFDICVGRQ